MENPVIPRYYKSAARKEKKRECVGAAVARRLRQAAGHYIGLPA